ncbi:MAG: malate dehydrogenase [Thermoproteota archaeon]|nr:malate dehydrogenase [Thermoproteota archaeon]
MNISIIGSGRVGSSVALNCCLRELGDVLLLDIISGLPHGESLDINHQLAELGNDCHVRGSNDYQDMKNSDFIVIVAGIGRKPGMTRMDLLKTNAGIVKDVCKKIRSYSPTSTVIVVTNPLDPLTYLALKIIDSQREKVMGMGGMLDLSRFKEYISSSTGMSRSSIQAMVIGEHGENMLPLVRFSSISGIPLSTFVNTNESDELVTKTRNVAEEVISLKGATVYAPGNAVSVMIEAIIKNRRAILPVSVSLEGEYGYHDVCIGVPCVLGSKGIEKIIELDLNPAEKEIFTKGIESVESAISELPL